MMFKKSDQLDSVILDLLAAEKVSYEDYYVAVLDGKKCQTWEQFSCEIGKAFEFPDYCNGIMNSLDECINDLEWIDKPNYYLLIKDSQEFFAKEPEEDRDHIVSFLERVSKEWAGVPNYEGEDIYRAKADFKIKYL